MKENIVFVPNPSATTASPSDSDIAQLVGLLSNLMPLLLRVQSQEQPFQAGLGNAVMPNPALDRQASENLVADIIAGSLRTLSAYLEANAGRHAGLESCIPIVTQAAHRFAARDYAEAFNLVWLAYRAIEAIRATDPQIPPLRAGGWASADQPSSSIH
jgi:hypothetical protein